MPQRLPQHLKNKVAVVTGAGRGIGRAEALALAAEGARVVVNDYGGEKDGAGSSPSPADQVVEEIRRAGGIAIASHDTVATWEGAERIIRGALDQFERLDILVNNAGILRDRMVYNMTEPEWDDVVKVHLYGTFFCTHQACRWFRQQRSGRIINTSSSAGLGVAGMANYSAVKEGIVGFTRSVARDMGRYGVTCNAIRPRAGTRMTLNPEMQASVARARAMGISGGVLSRELEHERLKPEEVAPFVAYLATDEAAGINGCVFFVAGGEIALYPEPAPVKTLYKEGMWTLEELVEAVPRTLSAGLVNPAPPAGPGP
ncbi:MAG: SDR family NAD(P)-dependent oxidoreductase [Dehalococcoidia bacterium]